MFTEHDFYMYMYLHPHNVQNFLKFLYLSLLLIAYGIQSFFLMLHVDNVIFLIS